jgi:hypothetical protein
LKTSTASAIRYERLPGRGYGVVNAGTLWLGPDHLLAVHAFPGGESYRRYFFRDIEAVLVRPTPRRLWINIVLLALAGLSLLPFLVIVGASDGAGSFMGGLFGVGLLFWLLAAAINTARGPTCEVRIQTAVQCDPVLALHREATARRVLEIVRARIVAAQGAESRGGDGVGA